jgi:FKBP-type peptidyl-prolyl cis-trans isomerase
LIVRWTAIRAYIEAGANVIDVGTLLDGSKFDSSRDRGSPFVTEIGIGRVIKGWDEGVPQLSVGQKANLICTPDYGKSPTRRKER